MLGSRSHDKSNTIQQGATLSAMPRVPVAKGPAGLPRLGCIGIQPGKIIASKLQVQRLFWAQLCDKHGTHRTQITLYNTKLWQPGDPLACRLSSMNATDPFKKKKKNVTAPRFLYVPPPPPASSSSNSRTTPSSPHENPVTGHSPCSLTCPDKHRKQNTNPDAEQRAGLTRTPPHTGQAPESAGTPHPPGEGSGGCGGGGGGGSWALLHDEPSWCHGGKGRGLGAPLFLSSFSCKEYMWV